MRECLICESSYLFSHDASEKWQCNSVDDNVLFYHGCISLPRYITLKIAKTSAKRDNWCECLMLYSSLDTDNNPSEEHAAE